jgi:hypothetical protein
MGNLNAYVRNSIHKNIDDKVNFIKQPSRNIRKPSNCTAKSKKFGKLSEKQIPKYRGVEKFVIYS